MVSPSKFVQGRQLKNEARESTHSYMGQVHMPTKYNQNCSKEIKVKSEKSSLKCINGRYLKNKARESINCIRFSCVGSQLLNMFRSYFLKVERINIII